MEILLAREQTLVVWPIPLGGTTRSGIQIAHHDSLPCVMAFVKQCHPSVTEVEVGEVVVFRQHALDRVDLASLLPLFFMHVSNVRAVIKDYGDTNMQIVPHHDFILVEPDPAAETTQSGFALPETAQERPETGVARAFGPGTALLDGTRRPIAVEQDAHIVYHKMAGTELTLPDGSKHLLVRERDVLATLLP